MRILPTLSGRGGPVLAASPWLAKGSFGNHPPKLHTAIRLSGHLKLLPVPSQFRSMTRGEDTAFISRGALLHSANLLPQGCGQGGAVLREPAERSRGDIQIIKRIVDRIHLFKAAKARSHDVAGTKRVRCRQPVKQDSP